MAKIYKTARGKQIDIDRVKLSNETVHAVGNMKVNARGDKLGENNKIVMCRNAIMDQVYSVPTGPSEQEIYAEHQKILEASKAKELHDLVSNLTQSVSTETAQTQPTTPPARGSLAGSMAKPVNVVQQAAPTPQQIKKAQGPSRI